jgi:hypothetical protein
MDTFRFVCIFVLLKSILESDGLVLTAVNSYDKSAEDEELVAVGYLGETHETRAADTQDVVEQQTAFPKSQVLY